MFWINKNKTLKRINKLVAPPWHKKLNRIVESNSEICCVTLQYFGNTLIILLTTIIDTVTEDGYNTSFEGIHATTGDRWRQHRRHSRFYWKFGNAFPTSNNQVMDLYGILPLSFVDSDTNLRICGGCVLKVETRNCKLLPQSSFEYIFLC